MWAPASCGGLRQRQSTAQQVLRHEESTRLQYGLVDRARQLGWPKERVLVIDDDLGHSAAEGEHRAGFQRLVSEVSLDHVGMMLGVEISRLARSSKDWHQLLEILCALFGTLIADLEKASATRRTSTTVCCWASKAR
jgi:DNA invertase Pin-like site-specific DNA recombinase